MPFQVRIATRRLRAERALELGVHTALVVHVVSKAALVLIVTAAVFVRAVEPAAVFGRGACNPTITRTHAGETRKHSEPRITIYIIIQV